MNSSSQIKSPKLSEADALRHASYPKEMIGHGQHGENLLLAKIFAGSASGVCVEVGAFDGIVGSATYAFEQLGWTAILIEPQPELAAAIARSRCGRLFAVAAGAVNGEARIIPHPDDSAQSGVAIHNSAPAEAHDVHTPSAVVQMRTMDSILEESGVTHVDFATIDVEGFELDVLKGWDLERWRPRILILEDNSRGIDNDLARHLSDRNYVCFRRTGVNDWYARRATEA